MDASELPARARGRVPPQDDPDTRGDDRNELPLLPSGKVEPESDRRTRRPARRHPEQRPRTGSPESGRNVLEVIASAATTSSWTSAATRSAPRFVTAEVHKAFGSSCSSHPRGVRRSPRWRPRSRACERRPAGAPAVPRASQPGPYPLAVGQEVYWRDSLSPATRPASTTLPPGSSFAASSTPRRSSVRSRRSSAGMTCSGRPRRAGRKRFRSFIPCRSSSQRETIDLRREPDPAAAAAEIFAREELYAIRSTSARPAHPVSPPAHGRRHPRARSRGESRRRRHRDVAHLLPRARRALPGAPQGACLPLPKPGLQFGDYARWQRTNVHRR